MIRLGAGSSDRWTPPVHPQIDRRADCPGRPDAGALMSPARRRPTATKEPEMLRMPINWMKFAEAMSSMNPYGPVIMSDGSIYSPAARRLPPAATTTLDLTGPPQPRDARRRPRATATPAV